MNTTSKNGMLCIIRCGHTASVGSPPLPCSLRLLQTHRWQGIQNFFALMCTKVSICFFLIRIPIHKRYIVPLQAGIVVLILSNFILEFLWIFQTWPVQALWDGTIKPERNFTRQIKLNIILVQAIISLVSDFTFAFYPVLIFWHLQLRFKEKIGLCFLMGLGVM